MKKLTDMTKDVKDMTLDELVAEREQRIRDARKVYNEARDDAAKAYDAAVKQADVAYDNAYEAMQYELEPLIAAAEAKEVQP